MRKRDDSSQLDLDFSHSKSPSVPAAELSRNSAQVVPFVSAAAQEIRRNAVRRVAASGIFYVSPNLRKR